MSPMILLYIFIASIELISSAQFYQTAHLRPSSTSTVAGILVETGPGATVIDDHWFIDVLSQQGSDLSITMDSRWGFHDSYVSSVELYIEGRTTNETYDTDGEILFVFNVEQEYFAEMISIDARKSSYKECPSSNDPLITRDVSEMIAASIPDRYHRFCKNAVNTANAQATDNWDNVGTGSISYKQPAQWPMLIRVTNNPLLNTVSYTWTDAINGLNKVSSQFSSSFTPNRGMNIFIAGESPREDFFIYSVDITYRYEVLTPEPTPFPTPLPTDSPTVKPTRNPTTSLPTASPTRKPTISPTPKPTEAPTTAPSWSPTVFGETRSPTHKPSTSPTATPTKGTTVAPIVSTKIVNVNPTKILIVKEGSDGAISWFQAMIIIVAVFVFIVAWVGFCAFVFFVKRKPKSKKQKVNRHRSNSNQGEEDKSEEAADETPGDRLFNIPRKYNNNKDYKSESAMIPQKSEHIPDFLNIKMPTEIIKCQQKALYHQYQAQYAAPSQPVSSREYEAESQPMTPNQKGRTGATHLRHLDYSETDMGASETDELSRHDMIYIPGKQTKYREKYRASILRQQSNKQYKRYKISAQRPSLDI